MKNIIKRTIRPFLTVIVVVAVLTGCSNNNPPTTPDKPLNISVYLDLSDRLVKDTTKPDQKERDLAIIDILTDSFYNVTKGVNLLSSKNKINIIFYPAPHDPNINKLSDSLKFDISEFTIPQRKKALNGLKKKFHYSLSEIYDLTIAQQNWIGSDIWGFFRDKSKIDVQCIDKDYRNVLVILTDGFLYDKKNEQNEDHAYSYISSKTLKDSVSSLIVSRKGLDDLEVLVLEIAPGDEDQKTKMEQVLTNWFNAMGIQHVQIAERDVAKNTKNVIYKFFNDTIPPIKATNTQ